MSNVIAFMPERGGKAVADRGADMGRILLFTGVRYLRDDVDAELEAEIVPGEAEPLDEAATIERLKA